MLNPGARLGPYEVVALIGAGGMGEVYRARDTRLGRDVAIKVLPTEFAADPDRLHRFEQEAKAVAALNHPNILALFDVGTHERSPFIVSELLEGETLRDRLRSGALPVRKAVETAVQIAHGLAAAHSKGFVHRDLKPENVFATRDGVVKILDFGIAKLTRRREGVEGAAATTIAGGTDPGTVLGTVGYMSPEQAQGLVADFPSDQFSFGAILYEMLTGTRAFARDSAVDTLSAIIHDEPVPIVSLAPSVPPPASWIVERCLAKDPEERYGSTRDLARDLQRVRDQWSQPAAAAAARPAPARRVILWTLAALGSTSLIAAVVGLLAGLRLAEKPLPTFQRLTFRRGTISNARFTPEGASVIYSAAWDGRPFRLYSTRPESPESAELPLPEARLRSVSSRGELAIGVGVDYSTLALVSLTGGSPREVVKSTSAADWGPDGQAIATLTGAGGKTILEYPIGNALLESTRYLYLARVSPRGDRVAVVESPTYLSPQRHIIVVDRQKKATTLPGDWSRISGLAWTPSGEEVWFSTGEPDGSSAIHAVSLSGRHRLLLRLDRETLLLDVGKDHRVLISRPIERVGVLGLVPAAPLERDLSWLAWSSVMDISDDGGLVVLFAQSAGPRAAWAGYIRRTDGSPAVHMSDSPPAKLSPDQRWLVAGADQQVTRGLLLPVGAGRPVEIDPGTISDYHWVNWLPDGKSLVFDAREKDHLYRLWVQEVGGGKPRPISPEGVMLLKGGNGVSPDGRWVAASNETGRVSLYPIDGGEPRPAAGLEPGEVPVRWTADGRSLYVWRPGPPPVKVFRANVDTGARELWREITPADRAGISGIEQVQITPDGKWYAYTYSSSLSDLVLVGGLK